MANPDRSKDLTRARGLVLLFILCLTTGPLFMQMDWPAYAAYSVVPSIGLLVSIVLLFGVLQSSYGSRG